MTYKRISIIAGAAIILVAIVCFLINGVINRISQNASYKQIPPSVIKSSAKETVRTLNIEEKHVQKVTDPKELEKYGITITSRLSGPSTSEEWEQFVVKNLEKSKILDAPQSQEVIRSMQVSEEEYTQKMKELDDHVAIIKERLSEEPFSKKNQERLQNTYKLQAVGKALRNKVVAPPGDQFISGVLDSTSDVPAAPSQVTPSGEQQE